MSKEKETTNSEFNADGAGVNAKEMLLENGKKGTVIRFADRVKIRLVKDTKYQKAGKEYAPHRVKADWLVKNKIAEYVKD